MADSGFLGDLWFHATKNPQFPTKGGGLGEGGRSRGTRSKQTVKGWEEADGFTTGLLSVKKPAGGGVAPWGRRGQPDRSFGVNRPHRCSAMNSACRHETLAFSRSMTWYQGKQCAVPADCLTL